MWTGLFRIKLRQNGCLLWNQKWIFIIYNCSIFIEWTTIGFSRRDVLGAVSEIIYRKKTEFVMFECDGLRVLTVVTEELHLLRCEAGSFCWTTCSYIPEYRVLWAGHCLNYTEIFISSFKYLNSFQHKYNLTCFVISRQEFLFEPHISSIYDRNKNVIFIDRCLKHAFGKFALKTTSNVSINVSSADKNTYLLRYSR